jgi:hypothetical protein
MDGKRRSECRAIGDGGMNGRRHWWTHGVALVRLWDSGRGSTRNKWKKEHGRLYCVKGADYGHGGGLKAGLCKLNRQEWWRRLQERTETMRSAFRNSETDWKGLLFNAIQYFNVLIVTKYTTLYYFSDAIRG